MADKKATRTRSNDNGKSNGAERGSVLLSAADLLSGGDEAIKRLDLPEVIKDGKIGYVHLRPLSSRMVVEFMQQSRGDNGEDDPVKQNEAMVRVISRCLVSPEGQRLYTEEQVEQMRDMRMSVFNRISSAIMSEINIGNALVASAEGKDASTATTGDSAASPTV
jgi:hypothetical protein